MHCFDSSECNHGMRWQMPRAVAAMLGLASTRLPLNRIVTDPPYCTMHHVPESPLPILLFVAGVEGSGHHALRSIWHQLQDKGQATVLEYDQLLHVLSISEHASFHTSSIDLNDHKRAWMDTFRLHTQKGKPRVLVDAQNSYPMGKMAGSLASPDIDMLMALDGLVFDLRAIVLSRNPTRTVLSAVRRFSSNDLDLVYKTPTFQARVVSEALTHLNNAVTRLPCGKWMTVQYEELVQAPTAFQASLATLLNLPARALDGAFKDIAAPSQQNSKSSLECHELDSFFKAQQFMWPLFPDAGQ